MPYLRPGGKRLQRSAGAYIESSQRQPKRVLFPISGVNFLGERHFYLDLCIGLPLLA